MPTPVLIAGAGGGTLGAFSGVVWGSVTRANGDVWQFISESTSSSPMGAYKLNAGGSFDEIAPGTGPNSQHAPMYWDGVSNLVTFLWNDGSTVALRDFNLDTQTWGADYGETNVPDPSYLPEALWKRSDGSLIAIFLHAGDATHYYRAIFSAGAWGGTLDICTLADAVFPGSFDTITSILDSSDVLHTIFHNFANDFFYQQVNQDGTLGVFQQFDQTGSPQNLNATATSSTMRISGDSLLWGVNRNGTNVDIGTYAFPAIAIGTPLSNPVWSFTDTIDPNAFVLVDGDPIPQVQPPTTYPNLFLLPGPVLQAVYIRSVYTGLDFPLKEGAIEISQTSVPGFLSGWTSAQFYDPNAAPTLFPPGDIAFGFEPLLSFNAQSQLNGISVDYTDTSGADLEQRYWFGVATPTPPPPPAMSPVAGGATGARFKPCVRSGQDYLAAQLAEKLRVERGKRDDWPYRHLFPAEIDVAVNQIADLVVPAVATPSTVLEYKVPTGKRFWMHGILQDASVTLQPGDASWTVDINAQVPDSSQASRVQGLINIPFPLGSLENGKVWWFPMPYLFEPLTVIRSRVTNNILGSGIGVFTSAFVGYLVPIL